MKSFKIFVSSPGDVKEERELAITILKEIEEEPSFQRDVHIDVVAWDKRNAGVPMLVNMTPQEAINEGLPMPSECDIVILIIWCRMGTPLPAQYLKEDGSPFNSGTEWEYHDALKGKNQNKPTVIVYRRMEPFSLIPNDPEAAERFRQYSLVETFFSSFKNTDGSLTAGYNQYKNLAEFKDTFRNHIIRVILQKNKSGASGNLTPASRPLVSPRLPHNLPSKSYHVYGSLLGRDEDKKRVIQALESRYPLISIEGMGGVGKSSLALEVADSCLRNPANSANHPISFDYIVWISAKDRPEQELWFDEVLNMIARVRDFFSLTQKPLTTEKIFEINSLLQQGSTLVIVDNFETIKDPELESWLESVPEPSKVIITSRRRQFRMSKPVDLEGLEVKDALELLRLHADSIGLEEIREKSDNELLPLVTNTAGNPLAIVWSLNSIKGGVFFEDLLKGLEVNYKNKNINKIIEYVFAQSWKSLSSNAQKVLSIVPLFVNVELICKEALQASSLLEVDDFNNAIGELIEFKLLQIERNHKGKAKYKVHSLTHTLARVKLNQRKKFEIAARKRWSEYYLKYIKVIERNQPDKRYWNVLVSPEMKIIDEEWSSINEVIKWADQNNQDRLFLDLIMLLVHYMDSRFLNLQRMQYVTKAVEIAHRLLQSEDEALLRLDALGWTLFEEGKLKAAYDEITFGLNIAKEIDKNNENRNDLLTLGYAWQARVEIELGHPVEASELIDKALKLSETCNFWIKSRVYMAAGDIALKQQDNKTALEHYNNQVESMVEYDGEGNGYQVEPRIGLAYVKTGELEKAEEKFNALRVDETIPIGKLYGDYGLALVAFRRNQKEEARRLAYETKEALSRKAASNILRKLIDELYEEMETESKNTWIKD
jgi:LuxR family glucitol operon transcriptional activator